jgi:hypothetical protein
MKYSELRAIAQDGDLVFMSGGNGLYARAISYFTNSKYTHVAFLFWHKYRLLVVESTGSGGVRIVQASHYDNRELELVRAPKPWQDIESIALSRSGTVKYGWFSAIYIGLKEFLLTRFNLRIPSILNNKNKVCSEFVAETLKLSDSDVSPGTLYKLFTQ